jgi:hypothetical protein
VEEGMNKRRSKDNKILGKKGKRRRDIWKR